ncbi:MAG: DUF3368 domain-containing protein [Deltaproteobacteria bacterium]|nr:DUF3368 domain-containing protein [Deltaproteobacteria bacterium]
MKRRWVVNASPIISLARISRTSLLHELCDALVIPRGVAYEIGQGARNDPARKWIRGAGARFLRGPVQVPPLVAAWDLGLGESEVIAYAYSHPGCEAILDDRAARRCALSLGIRVRGTVALIVLAKKEGLISEAAPVLNQLVRAGFRIDRDIISAALSLAGEK